MKVDFMDELILKTINEYKKYPVLRDPKDKFYKINNKKREAWNSIELVFQVDAEILKNKNSISGQTLTTLYNSFLPDISPSITNNQ